MKLSDFGDENEKTLQIRAKFGCIAKMSFSKNYAGIDFFQKMILGS